MADEVTPERFLVRLERLIARPVPLLKRIGALVASRSQRRFGEQQDPDGGRWAERWTPNIPGIIDDLQRGATIKQRRFDSRPALMDTGRLRNSIHWQLRSEQEVEIGTNLPYAKFHQFGLPRSVPVTTKVKEGLRSWLKSAVGRPWQPSLSWLLRADWVNFTVVRREFIGVSDEDAEDIRQVVVDGLVPPGGLPPGAVVT